jgi:DHA1 family multidrug resistance protein-like MFS transporter
MQVAMGIGVGLGPLLGGLVADLYGYRAAFYITSILLALAGVVVFWGVEEKYDGQRPAANHHQRFWQDWRRIWLTPGVAVIYGIRFINQAGRMVYVPVLPMFVMVLIDNPDRVNSFTGLMIGISATTTAAFSIILGRMGDRIGHHRILLGGILGCALLFLVQSLVTTGHQLLVVQAFTGVALGGVVPAVSALLAKFTRSGEEGAVYGLDNSITSAARALGPMLGVGVAALWGLRSVFGATALLYLLAAVLAACWLPRSIEH